MSLLSHNEIIQLLEDGVIEGWKDDAVNSASLDIHLGNEVLVEMPYCTKNEIDYTKREKLPMTAYVMGEDGYLLKPNEFILAHTSEVFHLPLDVSAEYKLKSSMARIGLEHLNAGWADAGWNGSVLTLELKNVSQYRSIRIRPGDAIGQMVFFRHEPVELDQSYAIRGRYNGDKSVSSIKQ